MFVASFNPQGGPLGSGANLRGLALLFVGWALGILSSPITDAIRRRSAKLRLTRALRTELQSLQDTLACVVIQIARRRSVLARSLLEALMSTLRSSGQVVDHGRALKSIVGLLQLDDLALTTQQAPDPSPPPRVPLSLKVYGVPFLNSQFHRLDLYTPETQRMLVELHAGLQQYNQHADEAMNYHLMSFGTGLGQERLDSLAEHVETSCERAAEKASDLVSRIAVLLHEPEMHDA